MIQLAAQEGFQWSKSERALAWRQLKGIRIVDQRSGFDKRMIYVEPLGHHCFDLTASSLISFGHINPYDSKLLASAEEDCIVIYQWQ